MNGKTRFTRLIKRSIVAGAAVLTLTTGISVAGAATNLLSNAGFEQPVAPANGFTTHQAGARLGSCGAAVVDGAPMWCWSVARGPVTVVDDGYWRPAQGTQSVGLQGTSEIRQSRIVKPNTLYSVSFSGAANPDFKGMAFAKLSVKEFDSWNRLIKQSQKDFSFTSTAKTTRAFPGWVSRGTSFASSTTTSTVVVSIAAVRYDGEFAVPAPTWFGPIVDNVSLAESTLI